MADRGDTHYYVPHLNRWFALSSVLLLVACVWMVLDDFYKPWKVYQREFREIEIARAEARLAEADALEAMAKEEEYQQLLAAEQTELLETRRAELEAAEEQLRQLRGAQFIATEDEKKAKQIYNWERFLIEEQRIHAGDATYGAERLQEVEDALFARAGEKEAADLAVSAQQEVIARLTADVDEAERRLKQATKDIDLVRKRLATLAPEDLPTKVANVLRDDVPGLDFVGPTIKVRKAVLSDLTFELNFTKKPRIDMCMTCHMAIDREGFTGEDVENPHRSHPDLDLYVTAKSPHPLSEVGCTICHRGSGEALDFQRVDHRPTDEAEGERWADEHHWHKEHYWDYPMLSSEYVQASCVQCHKDSMELIAEDAPRVSEGYQLFERYGCYACHKVEWYPTKRRPGPSLKGLREKTDQEFVASWVADPKGFRPTTWMPQIFHLENYPPEETVVVSEYGSGRPILGQEWNDTAVAAVSAFVWDRARDTQAPPIPVEGDAKRGREVFRLSGCLACHNVAPYEEEARVELASDFLADEALKLRGTNEHGPNLRGLATKVTPEWLFAWIQDPAAYWPETRMPDLRLSDQDAADIVAYVMEDPEGIFHDVPEGWEEAPSPYDLEVLREQARWFFNSVGREELARRFQEEWADQTELLRAVGEKHVLAQGCHSCHEIAGLESAMPIGTELTNWGSKTVDKLDWGFMHEIIAEQRGIEGNERHHFTAELKSYREPWLEQKLHEPRSFDRRKVKNPTEKLRMPWFDFTEREVQALATFVVGLVDDEVQRARMVPAPEEVAMDTGLRVIRQKNCASCHVIEPDTIEFTDEDGVHREVKGRLLAFEGETLPPPVEGFRAYVDDYVDYMREEDEEFELEDVAVQLLEPVPGLGEPGTIVVVEDVDSVQARPGWGGDFVRLVADHYLRPWGYDEETDSDVSLTGDPEGQGRVQDVDGEWRSYETEPYDKIRWTYAPPVLIDEGSKLQREWFYRFLVDPVPLRQQVRVRMPTFHWGEGEAGAVADYFAHAAAREWPARYARRLMLAREAGPEEIALDMAQNGINGSSAAQVLGIAEGRRVETEAGLPKLLAYGAATGFSTTPPVDPHYEAIPQRAPSTLGPLLEQQPSLFEQVHALVVNGPNCVQCHFLSGDPPTAEGPIAWAPDLSLTRERLRPDWTREWLTDPGKIYPGTAMPANFPPDEAVWQDLLPAPSREQIEAVLLWLFNLDRALLRN